MQRLGSRLLVRSLLERSQGFCTSSDKIVASVIFERLRVVIYPNRILLFTLFRSSNSIGNSSFAVLQMSSWTLLKTASLAAVKLRSLICVHRAKGEYQMDYIPAPRITEADKKNDRKSLCRALDQKLYLLVFGKPFWHFPEKVYDSEPTLRKCAESALKSVLGDLTHTYFVGNAPMAHMVLQPTEETPDLPSYKRFFFKCSVVAASKYNISNCQDFVWVTKDELLEFFPEQAEFFNKMIIG